MFGGVGYKFSRLSVSLKMIDYCDPDPKGDVELVLKTSDVPFALWDAAFDFQRLADNAENDRFGSTPDVLKPKFLEPGVFHGLCRCS